MALARPWLTVVLLTMTPAIVCQGEDLRADSIGSAGSISGPSSGTSNFGPRERSKRAAKPINWLHNYSDKATTPAASTGRPQLRSIAGKIILATSLVLAASLTCLYFGRPLIQRATGQSTCTTRMQVQDTLALGTRCFAQLLRVDDQNVLVLRDAHGIKAVSPLNQPFETELTRYTGEATVAKVSL